jgi:hypothetical protein
MGTEAPDEQQPTTRRPRRAGIALLIVAVAAVVGTGVAVASGQTATPEAGTASVSPTTEDVEAPDAAAPGPAASATPVDGSEVLPPTAEADRDRLPPREPDPVLVSAPLPTADSAQGRLVAGFPVAVVEPAPGSEVIDSSVTPEGSTLQVTLTARSERGVDEIRDHFRGVWTPLGLTAQNSTDSEIAFRSATASATLAVALTGTGTVYTVFATFRTE